MWSFEGSLIEGSFAKLTVCVRFRKNKRKSAVPWGL